jgi:hypothetical protein
MVTTKFTGPPTAVHGDAPGFPQVVHSGIHRRVLTLRGTGPSFAWQESLGAGPHVFWGRGANGPQRSERPPAMSLRRPGAPSRPSHDPNRLNAGIVGVACHAVRHETSAEAGAAAGVA